MRLESAVPYIISDCVATIIIAIIIGTALCILAIGLYRYINKKTEDGGADNQKYGKLYIIALILAITGVLICGAITLKTTAKVIFPYSYITYQSGSR